MISWLLVSDPTAVHEEINSLPAALKNAGAAYLVFVLLVFLVTRLNRDR